MRRVSRACIAVLFHGSSSLSLEDRVDGCQRFGLLGGASSTSQAGKEWVCYIHPPFSLAGLLSRTALRKTVLWKVTQFKV